MTDLSNKWVCVTGSPPLLKAVYSIIHATSTERVLAGLGASRLLSRSRGVCEENIEPLVHRRMGEDRIAQRHIGKLCQHRGLNNRHGLWRLRPHCREAKDAVALCIDEAFMNPRVSPRVRARRMEVMGVVTTRTSNPFCLASVSFSPTRASSGSMNTQ